MEVTKRQWPNTLMTEKSIYITHVAGTNYFVEVPVVTMRAPRSTADGGSQPTVAALLQTKQKLRLVIITYLQMYYYTRKTLAHVQPSI